VYLYAVTPHDPSSCVSVAAVRLIAAAAASIVLARRAARVDPLRG
jgi:hypothetical protein